MLSCAFPLRRHRLFELNCQTKDVFGIDRTVHPSAEELKQSGNLLHAVRMMHMFDAALNMLGPDTETLLEILQDLGKRHIQYQVKPEYFPVMGQAIIFALKETLGSAMTPEAVDAWVQVYALLSGEIIKSIRANSRN